MPLEPEAQPAPAEEVKTPVKEETTTKQIPRAPSGNQVSAPPESKPPAAAPAPIQAHVLSPTSNSVLPAMAHPVSNGTPYSTQVAQQFSTYQHTPSSVLERHDYPHERTEIPQVDTTGERSQINVVDRSVRPSEMKDEG